MEAIRGHFRSRGRRFGLVVLCVGLLSLAGSSVAQATTRTVTTTANSGAGSLRATIASSAPGDTVVVPASAQHYQVTSGEIPITVAPLTIQGAGAGSSVIDASGGSSRVFHVSASPASSQTITFSGVTITGGKATTMPGGGGILVDSVSPTVALNLALMGTTVSGNHATVSTGASTCCGGGGGIYSNGGSVTLNSSSVSSNTATVTGTGSGTGTTCCGGGGGIYDNTSVNGSAVTLTGSSVNNNIATVTDNDGVHGGGGIHVEGAHSTVIDIVVAGA
ncbi:MAG: hypothetical protein JOZ73_03110, partial [Solirubrobacterales bacterium]|nr:hypothetical protein [Solirubrobacterales bacterium]